MDTLRIVQLADIHFGQELEKDNHHIHEEVQRKLPDDLAFLRRKRGAADAVIVVGDTAYAGKPHQYKAAIEWLDRVCEASGCAKTAVFVVPGNHDIDFDQISYTTETNTEKIRSCSIENLTTEVGKLFSDPIAELSVLAKFQSYRSFAAGFNRDFAGAEDCYWTADLPQFGPLKLKLAGLNTALFCLRRDGPGDLLLTSKQLTKALITGADEELIVLLHHPFEYLKNKQQAEEWISARARIVLSGHEHVFRIQSIDSGVGFPRLELRSGAVTPPNQVDRYEFYYNWLEFSSRVTASQLSLAVDVWPRRWSTNRMEFTANMNQFSPAAEDHVFELKIGPWSQSDSSPQTDAGEQLPISEEPTGERIEQKDFLAAQHGGEVMNSSSQPQAENELRRLFWHTLSRAERLQLLLEMGLISDPGVVLTHNLERLAFDRVLTTHRAESLWDRIVELKGLQHMKHNPFK
jgi:predicted MPP superfamily phosphohydrolase